MKIHKLLDTLDIKHFLQEVTATTKEKRAFIQDIKKISDYPSFLCNLAFNRYKCLMVKVVDGNIQFLTPEEIESLLTEEDVLKLESNILFEILVKRQEKRLPLYFENFDSKGNLLGLTQDMFTTREMDRVYAEWETTPLQEKIVMINRLDYLNDRNLYNLVFKKAEDEKD